jgi:hypothetical protein
MELKQLSIEDQRTDVDVVRNIVEMVTGVSILAKNRKRFVVEARMIYSTLLREAGYSLPFIAETLDKDHTTIIHYVQSLKDLKETDMHTMRKYLRCRELFLSEKQPVNLVDDCENLRAEIYLLKEEIAQLKIADESRLMKIIKLIEENTPVGHELIVERKIRKMFDD